ncbi:hypothetical protein [Streptomyces sp. NPDC005549]|uniref:hypothetical protein n=1 Tax=Streptomyces sp. NPDC005549 TaxID=3154888 RepID=UPI0033B0F936
MASGFGPRADWYRNLREQPKAVPQFGNRRHSVTARFLAPEDGAALMEKYRAPTLRRAGRAIPFLRLESESCPREEADRS